MLHTARKDWLIMTCEKIIEKLEEIAPVSYAENWDNVGLLVGEKNKQVKKVMVALDATDSVIEQAVQGKVDLLITHHPMIFSPMKKITNEDFVGRRVIALIRSGIAYYAMHTNYDVCVMNDIAAEKMEIQVQDILEPVKEAEGEWKGIGKIGKLSAPCTVKELAEKVKEVFKISNVRITGDCNRKVETIAISTGSGKSMMKLALDKGAQVLITGDMDHHTVIDALDQGMQIIDAGHYGTEHFMVEEVVKYLTKQFAAKIEILCATEQSPFIII